MAGKGASSQRGGHKYKGSVLSKLFQSPDEANWTKEELLYVIFWVKIVLGIALGITWGVWALTGAQSFLLFLGIEVLTTIALYRSWLQIDEAEFGGHTELVMEGLPMAFGAFMLCWIITYSNLHAPPAISA